jgi:citrate synthase
LTSAETQKVVIRVGEKEAELPVVKATDGASGIDIKGLMAETGMSTYDQGFVNTSSTTSAITYIDGEAGILRYRGYPIEQLAEKKTFLDVSHLLVYGELPNEKEFAKFDDTIRKHTLLHENLKDFFRAFPPSAHPMAIISAAVSALSTFYPDSLDPKDPEQVENFLMMTFGTRAEQYAQNPVVTKALDTLLLLHADHEQNCSTSTVRLVGSSNANLFASVSAGVNALFGPLHGGANEAVLEMLEFIQDSGESVEKYVERVKNKEDGIRLMGFGHRVYKSFDPRAKIVKATADQVLDELGIDDPLLDIAKQLEAAALKDDYFAERKLYPNVDFYTGVIYKAMGFTPKMFTPMFAIGRLPGWIAHWREMMADDSTRIGRPQQVYIGATERSV